MTSLPVLADANDLGSLTMQDEQNGYYALVWCYVEPQLAYAESRSSSSSGKGNFKYKSKGGKSKTGKGKGRTYITTSSDECTIKGTVEDEDFYPNTDDDTLYGKSNADDGDNTHGKNNADDGNNADVGKNNADDKGIKCKPSWAELTSSDDDSKPAMTEAQKQRRKRKSNKIKKRKKEFLNRCKDSQTPPSRTWHYWSREVSTQTDISVRLW